MRAGKISRPTTKTMAKRTPLSQRAESTSKAVTKVAARSTRRNGKATAKPGKSSVKLAKVAAKSVAAKSSKAAAPKPPTKAVPSLASRADSQKGRSPTAGLRRQPSDSAKLQSLKLPPRLLDRRPASSEPATRMSAAGADLRPARPRGAPPQAGQRVPSVPGAPHTSAPPNSRGPSLRGPSRVDTLRADARDQGSAATFNGAANTRSRAPATADVAPGDASVRPPLPVPIASFTI